MLTRCWDAKRRLQNARVEKRVDSDGEVNYVFVPFNGRNQVLTEEEAKKVIREWSMVETTEEMRQEGWIK